MEHTQIMNMTRAYEEIIDFLAAGTTPDNLVAFHPSDASKARVAELIAREKSTGLNSEESSELDHYQHIEHMVRLAKARAQRHLAHE